MAIIDVGSVEIITALISIFFGFIIIIWKKSINYLIGIYFIIIGILSIIASI